MAALLDAKLHSLAGNSSRRERPLIKPDFDAFLVELSSQISTPVLLGAVVAQKDVIRKSLARHSWCLHYAWKVQPQPKPFNHSAAEPQPNPSTAEDAEGAEENESGNSSRERKNFRDSSTEDAEERGGKKRNNKQIRP